jgi:hypothetical protein
LLPNDRLNLRQGPLSPIVAGPCFASISHEFHGRD